MRSHRTTASDPFSQTAALLAGVDQALREGDPERAAVLAAKAAAEARALPVPGPHDRQSRRHLHTLRASTRRIDSALDRLSLLNGESLAKLVDATTAAPYVAGPGSVRRTATGLKRWEA